MFLMCGVPVIFMTVYYTMGILEKQPFWKTVKDTLKYGFFVTVICVILTIVISPAVKFDTNKGVAYERVVPIETVTEDGTKVIINDGEVICEHYQCYFEDYEGDPIVVHRKYGFKNEKRNLYWFAVPLWHDDYFIYIPEGE